MKWILRLAVVFVLLVVVALGVGYFFLNQIVQRVVEDAGTEATGTPTTLAGVGLSPFSGEANLTGFGIGNPEGFSDADVISFANADVQVDPASLLTDVIQVPRFHIDGVTVHVEYANGKANFLELYERVAGDAPEAPETDEPADGSAATKVVIGDLRLTNTKLLGSVQLPGSATPLELDLVLPPVQMQNVGSDGSGVTAKEAMQLVIRTVLANARDEALQLPDLEGIARNYLDNVLEERLGADLDGLRDRAESTRAEVEGVVEENRERLEGLRDGIGGLLGGEAAEGDPAPAGGVIEEGAAQLEETREQLDGLREGIGGLFGRGDSDREDE